MVQSLEKSGLKPGQWAVFPGGGGGVGIQGVQLAKAMGFRAIAIDTGADKKELCTRLGAEAFIDFKVVSNVAEEVIKVSDGIGAHGVFVTAPQAYRDAISYAGGRAGAIVMCIGLRMSFLTSADYLFARLTTSQLLPELFSLEPTRRNTSSRALPFPARLSVQ
jgi:propanol-preferring alcohol dehydrogenase